MPQPLSSRPPTAQVDVAATPSAPDDPAQAATSLAAFRRLSSVHEAERHAVAAALHDRVGQAVSAIKMSAHLSLDEADPAQRRDDLLEIIRIADDTVAQLRELYAQLRPPQLDALGLEAALRGELDRALPRGVEARLDLAALPRRADPEVETACFRIVQHCLRAASVIDSGVLSLSLHASGNDTLSLRLRLEAESDIGGDVSNHLSNRLDLALMQARTQCLGGWLRLERGGGSYAVLAQLPFSVAPALSPADDGQGGEAARA
jgi:glucose-6-phosphate-specific signal transduction histidine kinase